MSRKLASIQRIKDIRPIRNADNIEVATVRGWDVVVKKGEYEVGDLVIYCEIDSFLPVRDEFEFLRKSSFKTMVDGSEGFRLKTIKLRGQVSQGLILPLSTFVNYDYDVLVDDDYITLIDLLSGVDLRYYLGDDVSDELGITKYEKPVPACLSGEAKGYFPSFIRQTDQERVQNLENYDELVDKVWYFSEKLDGSSATYYLNGSHFGVCSRNLDLRETEGNTFWKVARELDIENKLRQFKLDGGFNIAIQGELIGEGIQGNPYKIKGQTVKFFDVFNIDEYSYLPPSEFDIVIMGQLDLQTVPNIGMGVKISHDIESMLNVAEGPSRLNFDVEREGIVVKNMIDGNESFKVISNKFLLGEK